MFTVVVAALKLSSQLSNIVIDMVDSCLTFFKTSYFRGGLIIKKRENFGHFPKKDISDFFEFQTYLKKF